MMIEDFTFAKERAVIINCGTHLSTTLAIMSVLRYCDMPLLVVNCQLPADTENNEYEYLKLLQKYCAEQSCGNFEMCDLPLRKHGETLDLLFASLNSEYILLVDSDLEVLNNTWLNEMRKWMMIDDCFGAGFYHGPYKGFANGRFPYAYYKERMWIPFCMLSVKKVREALKNNYSFNIVRTYNDFPSNQYIAKLLYRFSQKTGLNLKWNPFRKRIDGFKPDFLLADTGANIYSYLLDKGYFYAGVKTKVYPYYVAHYDGVTRSVLNNDNTATQYNDVQEIIKQRLKTEYYILVCNYNLTCC